MVAISAQRTATQRENHNEICRLSGLGWKIKRGHVLDAGRNLLDTEGMRKFRGRKPYFGPVIQQAELLCEGWAGAL